MSNNAFNKIEDKKPKNIVNTGYKIIKVLKLLFEKPQSFNDINEEFLKDQIVTKPVSDDMICIYINTLRSIGCEITRPSKSNNFCYTLSNHPFKIEINKKDSFVLSQIIKTVLAEDNWEIAWDTIELFREFKDFCTKNSDFGFLDALNYHFKINPEIIKDLEHYCKKTKLLSIKYHSPNSDIKEIEIVAEKIKLENNHFYIWGYNKKLDKIIYLRIDRIISVTPINVQSLFLSTKILFKARYKLFKDAKENFTEDSSTKIIKRTKQYIEIEENVRNKFHFIQKILQYADECILTEPLNIKKEIISIIKEVLAFYE